MRWTWIISSMGLILSLAFIGFVAINVPIAFSMGLASILGLLMKGDIPLVVVPQKIFTGCDSFPLLAVSFFILAGALMDTGGISMRLVNLARALVGHFRNGLGVFIGCSIGKVECLRSPNPSFPTWA